VRNAPAKTFRAGKIGLKLGEALPLARIKKRIRTVNVLVATYETFRNV
jgi:hypothetical protein